MEKVACNLHREREGRPINGQAVSQSERDPPSRLALTGQPYEGGKTMPHRRQRTESFPKNISELLHFCETSVIEVRDADGEANSDYEYNLEQLVIQKLQLLGKYTRYLLSAQQSKRFQCAPPPLIPSVDIKPAPVHECVTSLKKCIALCQQLLQSNSEMKSANSQDASGGPLEDKGTKRGQPKSSEKEESVAETGDARTPSGLTTAQHRKRLQNMMLAHRKAYLAFEYVQSKAGKRLEDREAYNLLKEEGIPDNAGDRGELTDYELPDSFETFRRYLSEARKLLDENKNKRRKGRPHGSSIARQDEIEQPEDEE